MFFSQVVKAEQQIVRKRVKKGYIVPGDSQWTKQWSLVSLDLAEFYVSLSRNYAETRTNS